MPSTHLSLNYHIVFSTKNREPILAASWRAELHAYLGGILRDLGGVAQEVGGVADHVHFLAALKATHCLADVLRDTKTGSSRWIHKTMRIRSFAWQEAYGAVRPMSPGCAGTLPAKPSIIARRRFRRNTGRSW